MKANDSTPGNRGAGEAADWFVRVDSADEPSSEAALSVWLVAQPANERALERVELAVELARRLAADPRSALYAEAARAARSTPRRLRFRSLAWGGALAAGLLVAVLVMTDAGRLIPAPDSAPTRAAQLVAVDAPSNPVAVLPNGVVVDASAVAVLPFAAAGDGTLADGLGREVVAVLRTVPGLYVIAGAAVSSYAHTDLSPAEIGVLLGARGIVDAAVEQVEGRVRVDARLRETATGATLWQADVDRPIDELRAVRDELAEEIAAAMLDSRLRAELVRAAGPVATLAAGSHFQP